MKNFTFHNTTKIIFGRNQIPEIVNEIPKDNKVMIIYGGGSVKRNGTLEKVRGSLKDHTIYEFGGVEANPHYETLMQAVALVKDKGVDFLLALGGGSVIDGTKFVAAAACYDGDAWDIVKSTGTPADWASHLIGQEITGLYGLDHACTLAVMIPAIWKFNLTDKKQKLAQYGERVWNIPASDTETMAIQAIDTTVAFFESMGIKTRLSDYGLGEDSIPAVIDKLKEHGHVALGEHGNITPEKVEAVLKIAL